MLNGVNFLSDASVSMKAVTHTYWIGNTKVAIESQCYWEGMNTVVLIKTENQKNKDWIITQIYSKIKSKMYKKTEYKHFNTSLPIDWKLNIYKYIPSKIISVKSKYLMQVALLFKSVT